MRSSMLVALISLTAVAAGVRAECRLYIVSQYDWGRKQGFYLDFEGSKLAELPVILGAADGENWRFDSCRPGFAAERPYRIRAEITAQHARLFLDGEPVAESKGTWQPARGPLEVNYRPAWASDVGDWLAIVQSISVVVVRDGQEAARHDFQFTNAESRAVLELFERGGGQSVELDTRPNDAVTIDVSLEFVASDLKHWAPIIDRYGQCRYAEWAEKVHGDEELVADLAREDAELVTMQRSSDYDEYGGYLKAGWKEAATGFFRVARHRSLWWLVTPAGNPCFYLGVCSFPGQTWPATPVSEREYLSEWLPPQEPPWSAARGWNYWGVQDGTEYICFYACNLIRKYGSSQWMERTAERGVRRLRAWGFSGVGKWGGHPGLVSLPVLHRWGVPSLVRHPDVFDPQAREAFRKDLEAQIAPRGNDPTVLGWSLGNEYDEIITAEEVKEILTKPPDTPSKRGLLDYAVDELYGGSIAQLAAAWQLEVADRAALYEAALSPPAEDVEQMRCFYAEKYYEFIYRTVKAIDPNHLYLGFWIVPGWWVNESDWPLIARHCDVIGYDRYSRDYHDERLARLEAATDKPVLCGEFSFPPFYDGLRGFGWYGAAWAKDDGEAGELYGRWVRAAAEDPYCVGLSYFEYRDQPLTGRGPGRGDHPTIGEHFAFGLVTETDRPKWDLVRHVRDANLHAATWRLEATR